MNKSKASLIQKAEALSAAESWSEACIAWQRVVDSDQRDAQAWSNLGLSRAYAGHYPEAIDAFGIAMQRGLPPDQAALGIGIVFCLRQQYDVARENLEMAVSSNPDNIGAWSNLVVACVRLGLVQRAIQAAEKVLAVSPDNVSVLSSLGTLFKDAGIPEEAVAWCRRAAQASPDDPRVVSNTLWAMLHSDTVSPTEIVAEARQFDIRARALAVKNTPLSLARATHKTGRKKIRVGWVSGDLRDHAVGNFVVPILEQLDRTQFESIVYYNSHISDAMSQRARQATARWHATADMSDAQLAARIRQDDVHLLIDLAGHTDGSRLQVFAHRPAPVQATWLGYPSTTGLTSMDYVLVPPDPILLAGGWCSETPLALPDCYCARDASQLSTEAMLAQPCDANGFITFGCLNNFAKVSPSAVATWARILDEVPDARLILVATGGTDDELVSDIRARFETLGVAAARLDIRSRMNLQTYRAAYREIDIGLDPFPFNGGTTGFDSLCMGAPFITLEGLGLHARMGGNLLRVIGLHELIASTVDDYVAKAVALASRREELRQIRVDLPQRMRASPLLDIKRFAHGLEQVFHKILR